MVNFLSRPVLDDDNASVLVGVGQGLHFLTLKLEVARAEKQIQLGAVEEQLCLPIEPA